MGLTDGLDLGLFGAGDELKVVEKDFGFGLGEGGADEGGKVFGVGDGGGEEEEVLLVFRSGCGFGFGSDFAAHS